MKFLAGLVIDIIGFVQCVVVMVIVTPIVWIATLVGCYLWEFIKWLFFIICFCCEWPFRKLFHCEYKPLKETHATIDSQNLPGDSPHTATYALATSAKKQINIFVSTTFMFSDLWGFKIIFPESVIAGLALGFSLHHFFSLHIAICIACGIVGGFLLLFLFHVKIGVWLVGTACSLFWGWFAADIAYTAGHHDTKTTLIWGIGTLLLAAAFHIKDATDL